MSRAVAATDFGGPEVLSVIDVDVPEPGPGQVVIDVRAAGLNPYDYKSYSGMYGTDRSRLPLRLGMEAAGVVRATGADATGPAGPIAVGDEVIAYPIDGGYAETLLVPASAVLPKPENLSWAQAAGLLLTGVTAAHALSVTGVGDGDTVLVHAAAGGVGSAAVQQARARGARVIGTASKEQHDYLRDLGAEPIEYGTGLVERVRAFAPDGVDVAVDAIGSDEALDASLALVPDRGRIVTLANFVGGTQAGIKVLGAGPGGDPGTEFRAAARLDIVRLAEAGRLRVRVAETYPLDRAGDAHRALRTGHSPGKLALVP